MIASAPGKVILFGEHAVVYGRHAIVTAINRRCYSSVTKDDNFSISSSIAITGLDYETHPYVSHAIRRFMEFKEIKGANIKIRSDIPVSSGLGSSAAVTVSVLKALNGEFDAGLRNEEIYEIAKNVELDVQGKASGTDPFISTFGGAWLIPDRKRFEIDGLGIMVMDTKESSVTSEMVKGVVKLKEAYSNIIDGIFDVIDSISLQSVSYLKNRDWSGLSVLININQCLLKSIGVSTIGIDKSIVELAEIGIHAKITGAGGGGCLISLGGREDISEKMRLLKSRIANGSELLLDLDTFMVEPESEGVRIEE